MDLHLYISRTIICPVDWNAIIVIVPTNRSVIMEVFRVMRVL